jgi:hypothetical protein
MTWSQREASTGIQNGHFGVSDHREQSKIEEKEIYSSINANRKFVIK